MRFLVLAALLQLIESGAQPLDESSFIQLEVSPNEAAPDYSFAENWDGQADRLWLGPDWFANNAQDWRIRRGRVECINSEAAVAGRTAHLLTHTVPEQQDHVSLSVTIGMVEPGPLAPRAFAGVLIQMGAPNADYRQTALVQMVPGRGGGVLVGLDAVGRLSVRRFSDPVHITTSLWVSAHPSGDGFDFGDLPVLAEDTTQLPPSAWPLQLSISFEKGREMLVQARGTDGSFSSLSTSAINDSIAGGVSLFSAYGPSGSSSGFYFDELLLTGTEPRPERAFGPVLGVLYTVATTGDGDYGLKGEDATALRLTAQHPVLGPPHRLDLWLSIDSVDGGSPLRGTFWSEDGSWNTRFVVPYSGKSREDAAYRLMLDGKVVYSGVIRREKSSPEAAVMASLSCAKNAYGTIGWDSDGMMFPFSGVTSSLQKHDPDVLFFAGDQVYDGDITPADLRSQHHTLLDYHTKWQRFLWSFGNLTKDRPTISIPDDHDMYQGNLFGNGGQTNMGRLSKGIAHYRIGAVGTSKRARAKNEKGEGYCMPAQFVNAVSATQVSHLPPSRLSALVGNEGANTYVTSFRYSGLDIIVLQDRTWKSGPATKELDPPLLGEEQERFLEAWAETRRNGSWAKVALSESPFLCVSTQWVGRDGTADKDHWGIMEFGEYPGQDQGSDAALALLAGLRDDMPKDAKDTNGWPPQARTRAVRLLARAGALHLTGDQHLGVVAQYGADAFDDGSTVFSSPAVASVFPRRWMPTRRGENRWAGAAPYMGGYLDALGNRLTMLAVSNPVKNDPRRRGVPRRFAERSPGYGIARFHPEGLRGDAAEIVLENWPPWADAGNASEMYDDWPVVLDARARPREVGRNRVPLRSAPAPPGRS